MKNGQTVELQARARAFSGQGPRLHKFHYDGFRLRVYDPIAGHYTTCHALTPAAYRRLVKLAITKGKEIQ